MSILDTILGSPDKVEPPKLEDYLAMIYANADINRPDQVTPFGGTSTTWENTPLDFDVWSNQNTTTTKGPPIRPYLGPDDAGMSRGEWDALYNTGGGETIPGTQAGYDDYLSNFDRGKATVETGFSPELQGLFSQQFDPDNYQKYSDDYMSNARRQLEPVFDRQLETFQQTMANRGQPVGGELYDDTYSNLMDSQNKGWENAAFTATQAGENARMQDFNRLMVAMGQNTIPVPQIDTMGPANMALNTSMLNTQNQNQNTSNLWNAATGLGSAYLMAKPQKSIWDSWGG